MKHLNVEFGEVEAVIVVQEVNRIAAYAVINTDNAVIFATGYCRAEIEANEEFLKYRDDWKVAVKFEKGL